MSEKKVTVRLPESVWAAISESASENRRSLNAEIVAALEFYVNDSSRKRIAISQAAVELQRDCIKAQEETREMQRHTNAMLSANSAELSEMLAQLRALVQPGGKE